MARLRETDLYPPIKAYLEAQNYRVKGEVEDCDVVAVRGSEDPVVVELKTAFNLGLLFQGVHRKSITDHVYLAVPAPSQRAGLWRQRYWDIIRLCRLLGLGLITVHLGARGRSSGVEVHLDPAPYRPRKNKLRRALLLGEFERRIGDPNPGGTNKRPIVTAYRQDALRCAWYLSRNGSAKAAHVRAGAAVDRAPAILLRDVYGWFRRVERGVYTLAPAGQTALAAYADVVARVIGDRAGAQGINV